MNLEPQIFNFLKELKKNNNRNWFKSNKDQFDVLNKNVKAYFQSVYEAEKSVFNWNKFKVFRIYRDVRFSKDKIPYKNHFGISFHRVKPKFRGGFYVHLEPNNSFIAAGFWNPHKDDLLRLRKEIEQDHEYFRTQIAKSNIHKYWGAIKGDKLKTTPKGFEKGHVANDLLQFKQFIFSKKIADKEIFSEDFDSLLLEHFKSLIPFLDYFGDVLTTDLNGESLI
jgi:uncharacterized protein (TIGR02453 family)